MQKNNKLELELELETVQHVYSFLREYLTIIKIKSPSRSVTN